MTGLEFLRAPIPRQSRSRTSFLSTARPSPPNTATSSLAGSAGWHGWPPASPRRKRGRPTNRRPRTRKGCTPTSSRCTPRRIDGSDVPPWKCFVPTEIVAQTLLSILPGSSSLDSVYLRVKVSAQNRHKLLLIEKPFTGQVINQGPILRLHRKPDRIQVICDGVSSRQLTRIGIQHIRI